MCIRDSTHTPALSAGLTSGIGKGRQATVPAYAPACVCPQEPLLPAGYEKAGALMSSGFALPDFLGQKRKKGLRFRKP